MRTQLPGCTWLRLFEPLSHSNFPNWRAAFGCAENQSKPVPFLWSGSARHSSGDLRVRSFNDRQRAIISTYKGFELEVRLRLRLRDLGVRTDLGEDGNAPSKWRIHQPVVLTLLSGGRVSMRSMANKDEGREPSLVGRSE